MHPPNVYPKSAVVFKRTYVAVKTTLWEGVVIECLCDWN